jgi:predicted phosphohydrolase/predicted kinase
MKIWHISDTHLSFLEDGSVKKDMSMRRWSIGSWTYVDYLPKMVKFSDDNFSDDDIVVITGDITHDMKQKEAFYSLEWLRKNIKGTLVIIRGNHDVLWDVGSMRKLTGNFTNFHLVDEGEIITIGEYTFGCFSNHKEKTLEFQNMASDGRYLEMAYNLSRHAKERKKTPVMISHYPANPDLAVGIGKAGVKAYLSGHVHCTAANEPGNDNGVSWMWYDKSAKLTDDQVIEGCFFSTGTTDVLLAKHGVSFKHIIALDAVQVNLASKPKEEVKTSADMVVLCGIPGSGKSTIAKILEGKDYVRVNQDELGSRPACVKVAEMALKKGENVVIDRCNFNEQQRKTWLDLANKFKVKNVRVVVLNIDASAAIERASARTDHPTIKDADTAHKAVTNIHSQFITPSQTEGKFDLIDVPANSTIEQTLQLILGDLSHGT